MGLVSVEILYQHLFLASLYKVFYDIKATYFDRVGAIGLLMFYHLVYLWVKVVFS